MNHTTIAPTRFIKLLSSLSLSSLLVFSNIFPHTSAAAPQTARAGQQPSQTPSNAKAPNSSDITAREDAYRANNLGVALLEQFNYREGAEAFRRALSLDSQLAIARINLAIALYNLTDLDGASREAQSAATLAPAAPQPHYILGLIAKSQNRSPQAVSEFRRVLEIDSEDVGANVNLGQLLMQTRNYAEASKLFRAALAAEPYNGTALYNLATALLRAGERAEGQRTLERFQMLRSTGAATIIGQNYLEQGRYSEAVTSTGAENELVDRKIPQVTFEDATAKMFQETKINQLNQLPRQPRQSNPPAAPPSEPAPAASLGGIFEGRDYEEAKSKLLASLGGGVTLFDFDGDGDLDLFDAGAPAETLYRNDAGRFVSVQMQPATSNKKVEATSIGAVAGDYDNDGKPDLFVLRDGALSLYHNAGGGRFADVTIAAGIPAYPYLSISAAFVDVDHDGDLDIFIAGLADLSKTPHRFKPHNAFSFPDDFPSAPNLLLRNNGDGHFADITAKAKVSGGTGHPIAVVPTDYDNRRDVDLLLVNYSAPHVLYRNMRDQTFRDVATEVGLDMKGRAENFASVAAGDFNKDGYTDFLFGTLAHGSLFAASDGREHFRLKTDSAQRRLKREVLPFGPAAAQFMDYDNDGLLDMVAPSRNGLLVWRNLGGEFMDVSAETAVGVGGDDIPLWKKYWSRTFAAGDLDGDGDTDLVLRSSADGSLVFARNQGGNRYASVRVLLKGTVSNRTGVEAKIEIRAGSLLQKLETYAATPAPAPADILFGIGARTRADAVRVIWPSGVVQSETELAAGATVTKEGAQPISGVRAATFSFTELDRKPSSCPYLFTWNGEQFEFITDFMGGGEMGYWEAPGVRAVPDPDEYVRIREDQLSARAGRYELRVTNELEEALYMDRLQLVAVAHPSAVEVYPNEGLGNPTSANFKLYATRDARPPDAARDEHGHDVLTALARVDRKYPDDFALKPVRGYASEHTLTLELGARREKKEATPPRVLLLMTGWTDYAFSSDNVAASQQGLSLQPPALQVKDRRGRWQTVIPDIGIPIGRPQTVTVDLTGKFLSASREVRIVTNMRIYWDQILVDKSGGAFPVRMERLEPAIADLRWRGFSAEASPDARQPFGYTYERVSLSSPWKTMPGRYTREGDVRELLSATDDMFVVSRPGDELVLSFDATRLAPLPHGWTRTFLLYADGFSKEMDINSSSPDQVAPLPFHGMKNYPSNAHEAYPLTPARTAYIERYNTRIVRAPLKTLIGEESKGEMDEKRSGEKVRRGSDEREAPR